ncbi:TrlF family AAA-like ATPase [Chitinophaga defluvii]|uniref:TrlF family AAA-like ATPase n=1 Tax=Chitinophaga defluvii TaxID=3163343 RepID=A0ABV2T6R1_9BACT
MNQEQQSKPMIFENGATWLRADFHLHTHKDKEFKPLDNPNDFFNQCIKRLKEEDVHIAVVTNHNKFDRDEFVNFRKKAWKEDIWILPGVELSVNDGANGIHCLIVFDHSSWITSQEDYINQFLTSAFEGIANRENENIRCNYSLENVLQKLSSHKLQGRDSFIVMAHVDQDSGFLKELDGGRKQQFAGSELFREFVLAFQKFRSYDQLQGLNQWFSGRLPAFVEGSDCKCVEDVGKAHKQNGEDKKTYIKIGAFNFDALKYALLDHEERVSHTPHNIEKAWLKSISFTTSKWQDRKLAFSSAMNNLIGIRGSGKSSLLETIRYALDIPLGANSHEPNYKERLVQNFLGSGGKLRVELINRYGQVFIAEKIMGESTNIYQDGQLQHNLKINAILNKPLYYGQKDLSDIGGETSTEDLISKLMGDKLAPIRQKVEEKNSEVTTLLTDVQRINKSLSQKKEIEERKASIELNMKIFKDNEIDKKLNKQIEFDKDNNRLDTILQFEHSVINGLQDTVNDFRELFAAQKNYQSKENPALFVSVYEAFSKFEETFLKISGIIEELKREKLSIDNLKDGFIEQYDQLKEEFSKIKREINLPNIEADAYVKLSKDLDLQNAKLIEIGKLDQRREQVLQKLKQALVDLKGLWHAEYQMVVQEVEKLNTDQSKLRIEVNFKGNKDRFKEFIRASVRGSGLRDAALSEIADHYTDLIEVYNDLRVDGSKVSGILSGGNNLSNFTGKFKDNINAFLTYRVPDKYVIYYNERPLNEHSLGQRASALILFILTLKENDIIIIDQPEDDLDNQTIYTDVITELRKLKDKTQFIFATHNPNIPVLGDCEQTICCSYNNGVISTIEGSIDDTTIQKKIVNIMEGGEEAFNQRKMIYELWKH